jgi:hypothetical protein
MVVTSARSRILEAFLFAVSSVVLYNLWIGLLFFLVPLQVVAARRGQSGFLPAAGLFLVMAVGVSVVRAAAAARGVDWGGLVAAEAAILLTLLVGLGMVNLRALGGFRGLTRLLAATLAVGLLAIPLFLIVPGLPGFRKAMEGVFSDITKTLQSLVSPAGAAPSFLGPLLQPAELMRISVEYFLRSFLLDVFVLLGFSWWAGTAAAARTATPGLRRPAPRLAAFRLEAFYLWPLIAAWAAILLDLVVGISIASYVAWNVGLVLLFLYGLQGLAIVRFLMEKHHLPRLLWWVLLAFLAVLLASPRGSLFVVIAVPAFGVSENWVRYRIRGDSDQSGKE